MANQQRIITITPKEREQRAIRKRSRTAWITGATEADKKAALQMATSAGSKKYSWLQQNTPNMAQTLSQKRAVVELGIKTGRIAEDLKIAKHGEDVGVALAPTPENIVGGSAASEKERPNSQGSTSSETAPITSTPVTPTMPTTLVAPKKGGGKKRAVGTDTKGENMNPAKKRKGKAKATVPKLNLPSQDSSGSANNPCLTNCIDPILMGGKALFSPRLSICPELEAGSCSPRTPGSPTSNMGGLFGPVELPPTTPEPAPESDLEAWMEAQLMADVEMEFQ
ncbi:hypothetical protein EKO27_g6482 [Xylaria grammica]|uniref:Uncharacterized protein n=1 Tax=Xylaria grammica TaxID=363999 RepID=A0A439D2Y3_9PEZI|nr:hypothetical protein EKO27_g6482 [Xylaria grammica]